MPLKISFIIACFELSFFENHSNVMVQYVWQNKQRNHVMRRTAASTVKFQEELLWFATESLSRAVISFTSYRSGGWEVKESFCLRVALSHSVCPCDLDKVWCDLIAKILPSKRPRNIFTVFCGLLAFEHSPVLFRLTILARGSLSFAEREEVFWSNWPGV